MRVSVVLFAGYREAVDASSVGIDLPEDATVGDLTREMAGRYPSLPQDAEHIAVAVNDEFRPHDFRLSQGDEVALIPPVSGGAHHILVTTAPLNPADYAELVRTGSAGAVVTFLGMTRNENAGRVVTLLEYEGYRPMADKMLARVANEMASPRSRTSSPTLSPKPLPLESRRGASSRSQVGPSEAKPLG